MKSLLSQLDLIRAQFLKETLKFSWLKELFHSRSQRILALFMAALGFYALASSFFPLWVLLIGPIVWGVPHIIASLRYTSLSYEKNTRNQLLRFQFFIWAVVFIYRLSSDVLHLPVWLAQYPLLFESLCLGLSFFYQLYLYKKINLKLFLSFLIFTLMLAFTYINPIATALTLLIGHNYIPLWAWFQACQTRQDRNTFLVASLLYLSTSVAIFYGAFDAAYAWLTPHAHIDFLNWDYSEVISPFVSGDYDYQFWFHIVVLYAFSQAMHYFIWLKAIPENYQQSEFPPSFHWSFKKLTSDFGSSSLILLVSLCAISLLTWLFLEFQMARLVYFSLASYHGFMEISAMPFLQSNLKADESSSDD